LFEGINGGVIFNDQHYPQTFVCVLRDTEWALIPGTLFSVIRLLLQFNSLHVVDHTLPLGAPILGIPPEQEALACLHGVPFSAADYV